MKVLNETEETGSSDKNTRKNFREQKIEDLKKKMAELTKTPRESRKKDD